MIPFIDFDTIEDEENEIYERVRVRKIKELEAYDSQFHGVPDCCQP